MFVSAESGKNKRFIPLWRAGKKLAALAFLFVVLLSASAVYSYSEKTAPTPALRVELDILYNSTTASTATIRMLSVQGKTIYINKLHIVVSGFPGINALKHKQTMSLDFFSTIRIKSAEDLESGGELTDIAEKGISDADYFVVDQELEMWNNDTKYYTSACIDNSNCKLVLYTDSLSGTPIVYVNNSVYWNESKIGTNYSDAFWWVPLPQGKLANISVTGVTKKTVFKLVRVVWYTLDYRFATTDSDLNTLEPEETYDQNEEMLLIGTDDLDSYIYDLAEQKLRELGYTDIVDSGFVYNITKPQIGFTRLKYSTIEASVFAVFRFILFEDIKVLGWRFPSFDMRSSVKRLHLAVSGTVNTLVKRITSTTSYIKKNAAKFANVYITNVKKAVKKANDLGKGFVTSVSSGVKAVGNFFNNVGSTVSNAVQGFGSSVTNGAKTVWKSVSTWAGNVYRGVTGFFGGIVSWFKKFWWALVIIALLIFVPVIIIIAMNLGSAARSRF